MNAEQARKVADRIIRTPAALWDQLTDPVYPERVNAAIVLVLLLGATYTGATAGFWLVAIYVYLDLTLTTVRRVRRWLAARRERKQAKVIQADPAQAPS